MGKRGKGKLTGSPDVQKFKQTREFQLLEECATLFEGLPILSTDAVSETDWKKVTLFLCILGQLAEHTQSQSNRDFRFTYHHQYLLPAPQLYPSGFDVDVLRKVRHMQEYGKVEFNKKEYRYTTEIEARGEKFLKDVDAGFNKIFCATIEPRLQDDFEATGLKQFKYILKEELQVFDVMWAKFEALFAKAHMSILEKVFEQIERLVTTEAALCIAEKCDDLDEKRSLENAFAQLAESYVRDLFAEKSKGPRFSDDVIPLAEACLFYSSKCTADMLHLAKTVIKDYMELRLYVTRIPQERLSPHLKENAELNRLMLAFHASVLDAREAFDFASKLPNIIFTKTSDWMTRDLVEPDVRVAQRECLAQLART